MVGKTKKKKLGKMKKEKKNLLGKWRQVLKSKIQRKGKVEKLEKGG
jgi:hypothetical protein